MCPNSPAARDLPISKSDRVETHSTAPPLWRRSVRRADPDGSCRETDHTAAAWLQFLSMVTAQRLSFHPWHRLVARNADDGDNLQATIEKTKQEWADTQSNWRSVCVEADRIERGESDRGGDRNGATAQSILPRRLVKLELSALRWRMKTRGI